MLKRKKTADVKTIIAPEGNRGASALIIEPSMQLAAPMRPAKTVMRNKLPVQNRAAAAGITNSAIINTKPTACSPTIVTKTTVAIRTLYPVR